MLLYVIMAFGLVAALSALWGFGGPVVARLLTRNANRESDDQALSSMFVARFVSIAAGFVFFLLAALSELG